MTEKRIALTVKVTQTKCTQKSISTIELVNWTFFVLNIENPITEDTKMLHLK